MTYDIRPAANADREHVLALAPRLREGVAGWRDPVAVAQAVQSWVTEALDRVAENGRTVLVAEELGTVIGFITVETKGHWSGARDAYIGELVVAPHAEGRGIGSDLIRSAVEWSRRQGLERISVSTGAANVRARSTYQRLGFEDEDVTLSMST